MVSLAALAVLASPRAYVVHVTQIRLSDAVQQAVSIKAFANQVAAADIETPWKAAATWSIGTDETVGSFQQATLNAYLAEFPLQRSRVAELVWGGNTTSWTILTAAGQEAAVSTSSPPSQGAATGAMVAAWKALPVDEGGKVRLSLTHTRSVVTDGQETVTLRIKLGPLMSVGETLMARVEAEDQVWFYTVRLSAAI